MILGPYREDGYQPPALATLDHIVPRAKGGTWAIKNLQLLRRDCNERKGSGPHGAMEFGETEAGQLQEELRRWLGASPLRNSAGK